jgi:hypothetical protein
LNLILLPTEERETLLFCSGSSCLTRSFFLIHCLRYRGLTFTGAESAEWSGNQIQEIQCNFSQNTQIRAFGKPAAKNSSG